MEQQGLSEQEHTGILSRLSEEFRGMFSHETIERYLVESLDRWPDAHIVTYLPLLIERHARENLGAAGQAQGLIAKEVPEILFVCVHNAGRSQMAAALLERHAAGRVHVRSAGSTPAEAINPAVTEALAELGVDIGREFPKPLTDEFVRAADVVVTMGCGDACPVYPGKRYMDWDLPDPAGKSLAEVRLIRHDIEERVLSLLSELTPAAR